MKFGLPVSTALDITSEGVARMVDTFLYLNLFCPSPWLVPGSLQLCAFRREHRTSFNVTLHGGIMRDILIMGIIIVYI